LDDEAGGYGDGSDKEGEVTGLDGVSSVTTLNFLSPTGFEYEEGAGIGNGKGREGPGGKGAVENDESEDSSSVAKLNLRSASDLPEELSVRAPGTMS
jgi:hypothetical protein